METSIFGRILAELVERMPGVEGAVFADWEGEAVDQVSCFPDREIRLFGAHWGVVYFLASRRWHELKLGEISQLCCRFERQQVVVQRVDESYFVALWLDRRCNIGEVLLSLEPTVRRLREEM